SPTGGSDASGPAPNYMFVTSVGYNIMTIGGLPGADMACQQAASGKLAGNFVAWLSAVGSDAIGRINIASGWVRPDGKPFADQSSDLARGAIFYPPLIDEDGAPVPPDTLVATGTSSNGTDALDCFRSV